MALTKRLDNVEKANLMAIATLSVVASMADFNLIDSYAFEVAEKGTFVVLVFQSSDEAAGLG